MTAAKKSSGAINLNQLAMSIPIRQSLLTQSNRDEFEWSQWQSATKAINSTESAVKEKHVRNLTVGTFQLEGARLFWTMMTRIQLESHPIVSWRFCFVVHRLLRDGHRHVIYDSLLMVPYFEQMRKYWSGQQYHYGLLTYRYCHLLLSKLKFHQRHGSFTGNLAIDQHNDIRRLFNENFDLNRQLCVELLDYLEELLVLVQAVFKSLDQSRSNSMLPAGQCRLNPMVVCVQDSSSLYDYIVKILFQLHEGLPGNTLQEHRDRFADQFRRLKSFYSQSAKLQYFKNLIQIPLLPENPPNFKARDDLKNYQSPVAVLSETSSPSSPTGSTPNESLLSRANEASALQQKLTQSEAMLEQTRSETDDLHRTIATKEEELLAERNRRVQIEEQLRQQLSNQRSVEEIRTLKQPAGSDEKFQKLLETYNKLSEEHAVALRQQGELRKQLEEANQQYGQSKEEHKKKEVELQQHSDKTNAELNELRQTNDELQARIQGLTNERNDYAALTETTKERLKEIEVAKQSIEERFKEVENDRLRIDEEKTNYERKLKETQLVRRDLSDKNQEHEENLIDLIYEKETLEEKVADLEHTIREWAQKFIDMADKQKLIQVNHESLIISTRRQYKASILTYCTNQINDAIHRTENAEFIKCKADPAHLLSQLTVAMTSTETLRNLWKSQSELNEDDTSSFFNECIALAHAMIDVILHGTTTSSLVTGKDQSAVFANQCRDAARLCTNLYSTYQTSSASNDVDQQSNEILHRLKSLAEKTQALIDVPNPRK